MSRNRWTDDKLLIRLINNKSNKTRWKNIGELQKRPSETLFSKCVELVNSEDPKKRSIGVDILAKLGLPPRPFLKKTNELFFNLLKTETNPKVLISLLYAIGHNNDNLAKSQIINLCSFSNSNNVYIKGGLVSALLGIEDAQAIGTLIKLSSDKSTYVRDWATFGIGTQIDKDNELIRAALRERVNDSDPNTKLEAIVGLAKRKDIRIKEIIVRELKEGEYGKLLFEAIELFEAKELLPYLRNNLEMGKTDKGIAPEWLVDLEYLIDKLENK